MLRRVTFVAIGLILLVPGVAQAATPTLTPNSQGKGKITWTGSVSAGTAEGGSTDDCFDASDKPDSLSGCGFYRFNVNTEKRFYDRFLGGVQLTLSGFSPFDLDMAVYKLKADGSRGTQAGASGNAPGEDETTTMPDARGSYLLAVVPFAAPPGTSYTGVAAFNLRVANPRLPGLNRRIGPGPRNYRASHDRYVSHSEPSIAMDPLNHNHLVAGSKMYESLPKYFFKTGTYESFDGGRHWKDWGQLPGYCEAPGQCNPNDDVNYRVVSDIALAFDDEGNAYSNTLDAPGGATGTGWNQTINIKRPHKRWSKPIVVHDNRNNPLTEQLLLDDKNWIAVDNNTDPNGAPNKPRDGKVGNLYVCWGLDGAVAPSQQIVLMRSTDGGKTWGGEVPGDNTPIQLSQKQAISGIGCHIVIGSAGEVYVTWYDNQIDALMQVKSITHGATFTPARPIATIVGVNEQFERQSFRNLSIPTTGIDRKGNLYVVDSSLGGEGGPVTEETPAELKKLAQERRAEEEAAGDSGTGADIVMFKSTDGGNTYTGPIRVNQDGKKSHRDQFQPWMAVTPKGQLNVMYFDKRRDPNNFFIGTTLSRSNNGGKTWKDTRVDHRMWDPRINPPISPSGQFIGDYQGLVADDKVAIPFWNDTQGAALKKGAKGYSPWQEVYAARIPNRKGGGKCRDRRAPKTSLPRKNVTRDASGRMHFHGTARDKGCKHKLKFVRVSIARYKHEGGKCRFMKKNGKFTHARRCSKRLQMRAEGTKKWSFTSSSAVPKGRYRITASAVDRAGNREKPVFGRNTVKFRAR
jgi:hypothetical protein